MSIFFFLIIERPLHPKEKVLEQALQWCTMADPSSAYLLVKKVPRGEMIDIFTGDFIGFINLFAIKQLHNIK